MTKNEVLKRIAELEDLARAEGLTLPMPAAGIVLVEQHGHTVDLRTGQVLQGGDFARPWPTPAAALGLNGKGGRP